MRVGQRGVNAHMQGGPGGRQGASHGSSRPSIQRKDRVDGLQEGWALGRQANSRGFFVAIGNGLELKREGRTGNSLRNHQQKKKRERERRFREKG